MSLKVQCSLPKILVSVNLAVFSLLVDRKCSGLPNHRSAASALPTRWQVGSSRNISQVPACSLENTPSDRQTPQHRLASHSQQHRQILRHRERQSVLTAVLQLLLEVRVASVQIEENQESRAAQVAGLTKVLGVVFLTEVMSAMVLPLVERVASVAQEVLVVVFLPAAKAARMLHLAGQVVLAPFGQEVQGEVSLPTAKAARMLRLVGQVVLASFDQKVQGEVFLPAAKSVGQEVRGVVFLTMGTAAMLHLVGQVESVTIDQGARGVVFLTRGTAVMLPQMEPALFGQEVLAAEFLKVGMLPLVEQAVLDQAVKLTEILA